MPRLINEAQDRWVYDRMPWSTQNDEQLWDLFWHRRWDEYDIAQHMRRTPPRVTERLITMTPGARGGTNPHQIRSPFDIRDRAIAEGRGLRPRAVLRTERMRVAEPATDPYRPFSSTFVRDITVNHYAPDDRSTPPRQVRRPADDDLVWLEESSTFHPGILDSLMYVPPSVDRSGGPWIGSGVASTVANGAYGAGGASTVGQDIRAQFENRARNQVAQAAVQAPPVRPFPTAAAPPEVPRHPYTSKQRAALLQAIYDGTSSMEAFEAARLAVGAAIAQETPDFDVATWVRPPGSPVRV